jgi:hypothetical protein
MVFLRAAIVGVENAGDGDVIVIAVLAIAVQ